MSMNELTTIQRSVPSRRESPNMEAMAAKAIEDGIRQLIETRYLYQKYELDFTAVEKFLSGLNFQFPSDYSPNGLRRMTGEALGKWRAEVRPAEIKRLMAEIVSRPWNLQTRYLGDSPQTAEITKFANVGTSPSGTPVAEMPIFFFAPAVQLQCPSCKRTSTFAAHPSSMRFSIDALHPRRVLSGQQLAVEQIYVPIYRCELCRTGVFTALIRRLGGKLHLCGFAPRRPALPSRSVPANVAEILRDAEQAVAEGDIFAAFYHLRTLLEHFIKYRLALAPATKMTGDDVIEQHFKSLPPAWRQVLPNITDAYSQLSANLHGRIGSVEEYPVLRNQICDHIEMLLMLEKQSRGASNPPQA